MKTIFIVFVLLLSANLFAMDVPTEDRGAKKFSVLVKSRMRGKTDMNDALSKEFYPGQIVTMIPSDECEVFSKPFGEKKVFIYKWRIRIDDLGVVNINFYSYRDSINKKSIMKTRLASFKIQQMGNLLSAQFFFTIYDMDYFADILESGSDN